MARGDVEWQCKGNAIEVAATKTATKDQLIKSKQRHSCLGVTLPIICHLESGKSVIIIKFN